MAATAVVPPPAGQVAQPATEFKRPVPAVGKSLDLSFYTPAIAVTKYHAVHPGAHKVNVDLRSVERYVDEKFDFNRGRLTFKIDGETLFDQEFARDEDEKFFKFSYDRSWTAGDHELRFEVKPVAPDHEQNRLLHVRLAAVTVQGPVENKYWVKSKQDENCFPRDAPRTARARWIYARELLEKFASRAFRRPAEAADVEHSVMLAESVYAKPANSFELGAAQAMVAVLTSPRIIFREEETEPLRPGQAYPQVDEYSLAARLSYLFWSSMPDDELFKLAAAGPLCANFPAQITRILQDPCSAQFVRNFTGQWLQARDIASMQIDLASIDQREPPDPALEAAFEAYAKINPIPEEKRTPEQVAALANAFKVYLASLQVPKAKLTTELRQAMQQETEMSFAYLLKEDRGLVETIEYDYPFLNEELAKHYGIGDVTHRSSFTFFPPSKKQNQPK